MTQQTNTTSSTSQAAQPQKFKQQAHDYLQEQLGMDDEQVSQILMSLTQPLKTTFETTEAAYISQNTSVLAEAAHSLKGALLNLGLNELAVLAKNIEHSAKNNEQKSHDTRLSFIRDNLSELTT